MEDSRWQGVKALPSPRVFWPALQPTRGVDSILSRDKVVKHDKSNKTMVELVTIEINPLSPNYLNSEAEVK